MYEIDDKDKVQEIKNAPQSSVGAPLPLVLSDEHNLLLAYLMQDTPSNWDGTWVRLVNSDSDEDIALVEFRRYRAFMFGPPNDEAFAGHPLSKRGLEPYSVFEVKNSSWLRKLERMNSIHPYHKPQQYERLKHFVFAFHDSTFECLAEGFVISIHKGSMKSILSTMQQSLFSEG